MKVTLKEVLFKIFLILGAIAIVIAISLQINKVVQRECIELVRLRVVKNSNERSVSKFTPYMQCLQTKGYAVIQDNTNIS